MKAVGPAKSTYTVDFARRRAPRRTGTPPERVPRVARLLALAHKIDGMIRTGELRDLADAARICGVTRARMTQIMNLLLLAPTIQDAILDLPARTTVTELPRSAAYGRSSQSQCGNSRPRC